MSDPVIYLDNAATSFPKAPGVADAMARFVREDAANPGRSGHRMAVRAEELLARTRVLLAKLLDTDAPQRLVFTLNTTDALNMALKGVLGGRAGGGEPAHVITTVLEHNSVNRPLQTLQDCGAVTITRVDGDGLGRIDPADIRAAITPATRLIVTTHASNVLGTIQDIAAIGAIAREHDLLYLVDAAQTAGVAPISLRTMAIDLLALPGHKSLLGPTGTGALYVGPRCPLPDDGEAEGGVLLPWREGGTGGDSTSPRQPASFPHYLEGGTPNTVGLAGLAAALEYLLQQSPGAGLQHEQRLVQRMIDALADRPGVSLYGPADATLRVGALALNVEGMEPTDLASILDDSFQIAVRPGLHCAPGAHRRIGTYPEGAVRVSPGPFSTDADIDHFLDALTQIVP